MHRLAIISIAIAALLLLPAWTVLGCGSDANDSDTGNGAGTGTELMHETVAGFQAYLPQDTNNIVIELRRTADNEIEARFMRPATQADEEWTQWYSIKDALARTAAAVKANEQEPEPATVVISFVTTDLEVPATVVLYGSIHFLFNVENVHAYQWILRTSEDRLTRLALPIDSEFAGDLSSTLNIVKVEGYMPRMSLNRIADGEDVQWILRPEGIAPTRATGGASEASELVVRALTDLDAMGTGAIVSIDPEGLTAVQFADVVVSIRRAHPYMHVHTKAPMLDGNINVDVPEGQAAPMLGGSGANLEFYVMHLGEVEPEEILPE